jgi:hypothetical protein
LSGWRKTSSLSGIEEAWFATGVAGRPAVASLGSALIIASTFVR